MIKKRLYNLSDVHLYCLTTIPREGRTYLDMVEAACRGGADAIQFREKAIPTRELVREAKDLKAVCDKYGALFFVNDRADVAFAADADGVHLGQEELSVKDARRIVGPAMLVGVSIHKIEQAVLHLDPRQWIERGERLVEQEKARSEHLGSRDTDALRHPAR